MLCARDDVRAGNMFGLPAFYAGARVFACVYRDGVGLKLPAERASQLLNRPDVRSFRPFNKPATREWIEIRRSTADAYRGDLPVFLESLRFVAELSARRRTIPVRRLRRASVVTVSGNE